MNHVSSFRFHLNQNYLLYNVLCKTPHQPVKTFYLGRSHLSIPCEFQVKVYTNARNMSLHNLHFTHCLLSPTFWFSVLTLWQAFISSYMISLLPSKFSLKSSQKWFFNLDVSKYPGIFFSFINVYNGEDSSMESSYMLWAIAQCIL